MTAFQQMSDASQNLLDEDALSAYSGAVLSPVNYDIDATREFTSRLRLKRAGDFDFLLDPQLYFPQSQRGQLRQWSYFPTNFDSSDRSSVTFWKDLARDVAKVGMDLRAKYVASPADVPKIYDNGYYTKLTEVGSSLAGMADDRFTPMQSVVVSMKEFDDETRPLKIASIISETKCPWIYLMVDADRDQRLELGDATGITGVMKLIRALESTNLRVHVAYSSSDVLLWKAAGATQASTGKYFNVRRFTRSRFEEKKSGGGAVEYWFEESLLAFIRQDDLLRLRKEGLLSEATLKSPFLAPVLDCIQKEVAWLRWSWLQYMRWFADVEGRLSSESTSSAKLIEAAEAKWKELDRRKVFMVERTNDGEWITRWKQALADFEKWERSRNQD